MQEEFTTYESCAAPKNGNDLDEERNLFLSSIGLHPASTVPPRKRMLYGRGMIQVLPKRNRMYFNDIRRRNRNDYDTIGECFHEVERQDLLHCTNELYHNFNANEMGSNLGLNMNSSPNIKCASNKQDQSQKEDKPVTSDSTSEKINGVPVKLLKHVVIMRKLLAIKRMKISTLRNMNNEVEIVRPNGKYGEINILQSNATGKPCYYKKSIRFPFTEEFQRMYLSYIVNLDCLNKEMQERLHELMDLTLALPLVRPEKLIESPKELFQKCRLEAEKCVADKNENLIKKPKTLDLIKDLTTLLVLLSKFGTVEGEIYQAADLFNIYIETLKSDYKPGKKKCFEELVEANLVLIKKNIR